MTGFLEGSSTQRLWPAVWKLLRLRLIILGRGFRRSPLRRKIGMVFLTLVVLAGIGFIFFLSWQFLRLLRAPELAQVLGDLTPLLHSVPVLVVSGAFFMVLLTSFGVLLQALYLAGDMDFLLSTPLPIRAVFIAKLLQAILPNFALVCLFALPVLYGLGFSAGYRLAYYPLVLFELVALALAAAGISALLVMSIVRIFPARRVAEVLGFIGAITSFICSQSGQIAQWNRFSPGQASQALDLVQRFDAAWSPLAWAGRGLVALGEGRWASGAGLAALTLAIAGSIFAASLVTAERLYYTGWASLQNKGRKTRTPRPRKASAPSAAAPSFWAAQIEMVLPSPLRAVLWKDWLVLRRDLRNMSQLVTPLIFGIIYAVMLLRDGGPSAAPDVPYWAQDIVRNFATYTSIALSLFVGWMLLGRLAGMGFSQEGRSYWLLKTAPLNAWLLIAAKFLAAYLPALALSWLFLLAVTLIQHPGLSVFAYALAVVALCLAGNTGLNLSFGITGANLDWEDPRQMQRASSSCLGALASMVYLPVNLLLFFGLPVGLSVFSSLAAVQLPQVVGQAAGLVLGGVVSLACAIVPLWLVRQRVEKLGES